MRNYCSTLSHFESIQNMDFDSYFDPKKNWRLMLKIESPKVDGIIWGKNCQKET